MRFSCMAMAAHDRVSQSCNNIPTKHKSRRQLWLLLIFGHSALAIFGKRQKVIHLTNPSVSFHSRHLKRILCFAGFCKNDVSDSHAVSHWSTAWEWSYTEKKLPHYLARYFIFALHIVAASSLFLCPSRWFGIFRRCECVFGWLAGVMAIVIFSRTKHRERKHTERSTTQLKYAVLLRWHSEWFSCASVCYMSFVSSHLCHAYDNDSFAAITFRFVF